jgi:hypothetical protein
MELILPCGDAIRHCRGKELIGSARRANGALMRADRRSNPRRIRRSYQRPRPASSLTSRAKAAGLSIPGPACSSDTPSGLNVGLGGRGGRWGQIKTSKFSSRSPTRRGLPRNAEDPLVGVDRGSATPRSGGSDGASSPAARNPAGAPARRWPSRGTNTRDPKAQRALGVGCHDASIQKA